MAKILQDISIGENLQRIRLEKKMTQMKVCEQMHLKGRTMLQSTYAQIETGVRNIFVSDLIVLKEVLDTTYDEMFKGLVPIIKPAEEFD